MLGNPGRSGHRAAVAASDLLFSARMTVADFFGLSMPENVIFTQNASHALNMAILGATGALSEKRTVITSVLEHNSVLRPLYMLERAGKAELRFLTPDISNPQDTLLRLSGLIDKSVGLVVLTARANTCGYSFPIEEIGKLLYNCNIPFIVDASQAAGTMNINLEKSKIDMLCFPGHKSLYGITGSGALLINPKSKIMPEPVISGGSGSLSTQHFMPEFLPDRLEAGTPPLIPAVSMAAGIEYINSVSLSEIAAKEQKLQSRLISGLSVNKKVTLYGCSPGSLVLFNIRGLSSEELAAKLDSEGIAVRGGFHCAPLAHRLFGTHENGAVRISIGAFNSESDIDSVLSAVSRL